MKNKVDILEFGFCWSLLVGNISATIRDRRNSLTYHGKISEQSIQKGYTERSMIRSSRSLSTRESWRVYVKSKCGHSIYV